MWERPIANSPLALSTIGYFFRREIRLAVCRGIAAAASRSATLASNAFEMGDASPAYRMRR
jgi:hypothetical protein